MVNQNAGRSIYNANITVVQSFSMMVNIRTMFVNSPVSRTNVVVANTMSFIMQDSVELVLKDMIGVSTCMIGKRPEPVDIPTPFDPPCPTSSSLPQMSEDRVVAIGIQATEVVKWCQVMKRDLNNSAIACETYQDAISGSKCESSCTNTTDAKRVISAWNDTCSAIEKLTNVTIVNGTLISHCNKTVGLNFTTTLKLTEEFITTVRSCSVCLSDELKNSKAKMVKKCQTGSSGSGNKSGNKPGSGEKTCSDRMKENAKVVRTVCQQNIAMSRKNGFRKRRMMRNQRQSMTTVVFNTMDDSVVSLDVICKRMYYNTPLKNGLEVLRGGMSGMKMKMQQVIFVFNNMTDDAVDKCQASVTDTANKAKDLVFNACQEFTDQLANDAELYPCCQPYGNFTVEIETNFTQNIQQKCLAAADNKTNEITALSGEVIGEFSVKWQNIFDDCDSCFPACAQYSDVGYCLAWYTSIRPDWTVCVGKVSCNILGRHQDINLNYSPG